MARWLNWISNGTGSRRTGALQKRRFAKVGGFRSEAVEPRLLLAAAVNDTFANSLTLTGSNVATTASNVGATIQQGEPGNAGNVGGSSLWWTWTASATGAVTINTEGSSFDTTLGVYTGAAVNSLVSVASNDDVSLTDNTSQVTFNAVAGTTYRISVDGDGGAQGSIDLNLNQVTNDNFANATVLTGANVTATGLNLGATVEAGEAGNAGGTASHSVWWSWTAPTSGNVTIATAGSTFDTTLGVYTGTSVGSLKSIAENDDVSANDLTSAVTFAAVAGQTYHISVDGFDGTTGKINLAINTTQTPVAPAGVANDNFANAIVITDANVTTTASNVGATAESGEQGNAGSAASHSLWWVWTAPTTGAYTINTAGSDFDTTLGVYQGTAVSALTSIAENDDVSTHDTTSVVTINATAGQQYYISVDGFNGYTGNITLNIVAPSGSGSGSGTGTGTSSPPANDFFNNAAVLTGTNISVSGINIGATIASNEPRNANITGGASVWYVWTATRSGSVTINTAGSNFDTTLGVYTGSSIGRLQRIASNDDVSRTDLTSRVTFNAVAGRTYHISIDGYHGAMGSFNLNLTQAASPPPPSHGHRHR